MVQAGKPAAGGASDAPAFADAAGCKAWLARLPQLSVAQRQARLAGQVKALPAAAVAATAKFEILELLHGAVAQVQADRAKQYRGKPLPLEAGEAAAFRDTAELWRLMAGAYDALIDAMAGPAPELAAHAAEICQRALHHTERCLFEYCHIYHAAPSALWQQLHRLYLFAENAGMTDTPVQDAAARRVSATSCGRTYRHALLLHLAQPDALTPAELDTVDGWLERWSPLVTLAPVAAAGSPIPALAVDLASGKGAALASQLGAGAGTVRHLQLDALNRALRQTLAGLKQQTPAQLGLGNLTREACERLLMRLHVQWCAAGTGRMDTRTPASIKVLISPNLASMHFHLTGKSFRQPGGEITAAERQRLEMFGSVSEAGEIALASQRSAALETWVIVNQSVSGFLGTTREKEVVSRISHRQLVALQPPTRKVMYLGVVQRLNVDEEGTMWIGLRIILGVPQAAAARIVEQPGAQYDRALLLPEDKARKVAASIVVLPGWFKPGRILSVYPEKEGERRIRLQSVLDAGPNFERASYTAA